MKLFIFLQIGMSKSNWWRAGRGPWGRVWGPTQSVIRSWGRDFTSIWVFSSENPSCEKSNHVTQLSVSYWYSYSKTLLVKHKCLSRLERSRFIFIFMIDFKSKCYEAPRIQLQTFNRQQYQLPKKKTLLLYKNVFLHFPFGSVKTDAF